MFYTDFDDEARASQKIAAQTDYVYVNGKVSALLRKDDVISNTLQISHDEISNEMRSFTIFDE